MTTPYSVPNHRVSPLRLQRGFTLIELMIVVTVIAILASIAYPSYRDYVMRARRATATGCLGELSQFMERSFTTTLRYDSVTALPTLECTTQLAGFYTFEFNGAVSPRAYAIRAVPDSTRQPDSACGTLGINQSGQKSPTTTGCWK